MKQPRSSHLYATRLKAIVPGTAVTLVLLAAWIAGSGVAFSPQCVVLLSMAWLFGIAWALRSQRPVTPDADTVQPADDYGVELQSLAALIETELAAESVAAHTEIQRSKAIVQEAVESLSRSFHRLGAHAQRPLQGLDTAMQQDVAGRARQRPSLLHETVQVDNTVAQAVRYLQFEDIVTQSLSTADRHLHRLNEFETWRRRLFDLACRPDALELQRLRSAVEAAVAARHNAGRSVAQESMAAGDVELF